MVEAVGSEVTTFIGGDCVYYAGAIDRPGANVVLHAMDERIVAHAPRSLDDISAALPLNAFTANDLLFDRLRIANGVGQVLLIAGGAGGVGSILIRLARQLTKSCIIATASRPETRPWCFNLCAMP